MTRGFTILELMVALTVLAILAGVAVPSFSTLLDNNRIQSRANTLFTSLVLARSEAVKRNQPVVLCESADGASCTGNSRWEQGWLVFADQDGDGALGSGEQIIQNYPSSKQLTIRADGGDATFKYKPDGSASDETFRICLDGDVDNARQIDVGFTGRPSKDKGADQCP